MGWQPIETAPKDGSEFYGKVADDAIRMFWHPGFKAFINSWRRMDFAAGYSMEAQEGELAGQYPDGRVYIDHSPRKFDPKWWMPMPPTPGAGDDQGSK